MRKSLLTLALIVVPAIVAAQGREPAQQPAAASHDSTKGKPATAPTHKKKTAPAAQQKKPATPTTQSDSARKP